MCQRLTQLINAPRVDADGAGAQRLRRARELAVNRRRRMRIDKGDNTSMIISIIVSSSSSSI